MARTDFEKVEKLLKKGLSKIAKDKLLKESGDKLPSKQLEKSEKETELSVKEQAHKNMLNALQRNLKSLIHKDKDLFKKLGIDKQEIKKFIDNPNKLNLEEWKKIKAISEKVDSYKQDMLENIEEGLDEKIIESAREEHINKRFRGRKGWLPLY